MVAARQKSSPAGPSLPDATSPPSLAQAESSALAAIVSANVLVVSIIVGSAIGQAYNGTTYPLAIGYLAIGLGVLTLVYLIEDRQLFRARHAG